MIHANDNFLYEPSINTTKGPHIRDAIDIKRWMVIVVLALLPPLLFGIWNTGLQAYVYESGDYEKMDAFLAASTSLEKYFDFAAQESRWMTIFGVGLSIVLPIILTGYIAGGIVEVIFACIRRHEISEGFLVTGMLYGLILPPTIPLWMVAVGVIIGVTLSKELFGGSGMNIMNPALTCRAFLFFTFPGRMSGEVWVGANPTTVRQSLLKMNQQAERSAIDGYTQNTSLGKFNVGTEIKRVHIDAIATPDLGNHVETLPTIEKSLTQWNEHNGTSFSLSDLSAEELRSFVTAPFQEGGLGLPSGSYEDAYQLSGLSYGLGTNNDWGFFLGNKMGCIGETSGLMILLGALFLIYTGIGSWRTMVAMAIGAFLTATAFNLGAWFLGPDGGAWNPAIYAFPAYKHLLLGGLLFGLVFMATDPVSSPGMNGAKWLYGLLAGMVTIIIRILNPAYPEGVMLSILMANVFAPLFDHYVVHTYRRRACRVVA